MQTKNILTGQPSDKYFKLLSVIIEHDSKLIEDSKVQCRLRDSIEKSVIFLHSDKSKCSIFGQCCANVLEISKKIVLKKL